MSVRNGFTNEQQILADRVVAAHAVVEEISRNTCSDEFDKTFCTIKILWLIDELHDIKSGLMSQERCGTAIIILAYYRLLRDLRQVQHQLRNKLNLVPI